MRSWLPLLVYFSVFPASEDLFLSTRRFRVLFFYQLYFVIPWSRKLTSDMSLFIPSILSPCSECLVTLFLSIAFSLISKWPTTLFLLVPSNQGLVAFLNWWQLITFFLSELSIGWSILLPYTLDNGTTSVYNSSPHPNAFFKICFRSRMSIISILSGHAFTQVSVIWT